jgi:hypothetical protein
MNHLRRVAGPAYVLVGILIVLPALDLFQAIWPLRPGDVSWRLVSVGLLSRVMITPILGLLVAYAAALLLEQRRVLRTLAVIEGILALTLVAVLVLYGLDAIELRARLASANRNYDVGILFSFVRYGLAFVILAVLAVSQWRAAGAMNREGRREKAEPAALLFHVSKKATESPAAPADAEPVRGG